MRKLSYFCLTLFLLIACSQSHNEDVIREQISRFDTAYKTGDFETLDRMISKDYLHTNPSGNVVTRENWLNWNSSRAEAIKSGELVIDTYETSELDIRIRNSTTAIVSGVNRASGTNKGEVFETKVRFTHVWLLEDGIWKRAVFHDSYLN